MRIGLSSDRKGDAWMRQFEKLDAGLGPSRCAGGLEGWWHFVFRALHSFPW